MTYLDLGIFLTVAGLVGFLYVRDVKRRPLSRREVRRRLGLKP